MPQLGETVIEGTITAWVAEVGQQIAVDDALFEVSTEKVDAEVPSAAAGYLRVILVAEGATVLVGVPVAIMTPGADDPIDLTQLETNEVLGGTLGTEEPVAAEASVSSDRGPSTLPAALGPSLSPVVRRLLTEHALDPHTVVGSGRDGRITKNDVLAVAAQRRSATARASSSDSGAGVAAATFAPIEVGPDDDVIDFSRARSATAQHMVRSLATAAHALVVVEVDYVAIEPIRRAAGLSYLSFVARAVVEAIREFPHLNASVDDERLVVHRQINLGIAVDVGQSALMVPVIHGAQDLRLEALSAAVADVADQARRRRLSGDTLTGGTFTLTNVGSYGTLFTAPIINQPQVAILSTDGIRMAPVAVRVDPEPDLTDRHREKEWAVAIHPVGNLSLSFDHRAFDGAYAAAFLARVRDILQTRAWSEETGT